MAHLLANFDEKLQTHLDTATVFKGIAPSIQNGLIESVGFVFLAEIKKELENCAFLFVLLDEALDISCFSRLSTVLRYVNADGIICERFIKFSDVSSAAAIGRLVVAQLTELGCLKKLIAQTYDGAAVMSSMLNGVQAKVFFVLFVLFAIFILHSRESELYRYTLDGKSALAWELPFLRFMGHLSST